MLRKVLSPDITPPISSDEAEENIKREDFVNKPGQNQLFMVKKKDWRGEGLGEEEHKGNEAKKFMGDEKIKGSKKERLDIQGIMKMVQEIKGIVDSKIVKINEKMLKLKDKEYDELSMYFHINVRFEDS